LNLPLLWTFGTKRHRCTSLNIYVYERLCMVSPTLLFVLSLRARYLRLIIHHSIAFRPFVPVAKDRIGTAYIEEG
jgi:hypothetical protein